MMQLTHRSASPYTLRMLGPITPNAPLTPSAPKGPIRPETRHPFGSRMNKLSNDEIPMVSAQELARRVGEPYDTVDHWAGEGLLPYRRRGRTRLFPVNENLKRCRKIRELQDSGHSLVTIKGMLTAKSQR